MIRQDHLEGVRYACQRERLTYLIDAVGVTQGNHEEVCIHAPLTYPYVLYDFSTFTVTCICALCGDTP